MYAQFTCVLSVMLPSFIYEQSKRDIERINGEIKDIEGKMMEIIESSDNLKDNYMPVGSVKGTALINTVSILVTTQNFTRFDSSRQFACYAGMAPFGSQSGASVKKMPHASHLTNKKINPKCPLEYN